VSSIDPIRPVTRSPVPQPLRRREREEKGDERDSRQEARDERASEEDGPTPTIDVRV